MKIILPPFIVARGVTNVNVILVWVGGRGAVRNLVSARFFGVHAPEEG